MPSTSTSSQTWWCSRGPPLTVERDENVAGAGVRVRLLMGRGVGSLPHADSRSAELPVDVQDLGDAGQYSGVDVRGDQMASTQGVRPALRTDGRDTMVRFRGSYSWRLALVF